ncbi:MAG TPA: PIG-L deacetylase family protein [Anaerolineaceae bacterium]|nr:PIG-L deacetylase family protein [Anaerolineaceae bacterium]
MGRSALVFAPHEDDEVLGCGGTIYKKRKAGAQVILVFMTNGSSSHRKFMPETVMSLIRAAEAKNASKKLGLGEEQVHFWEYPDGRLKLFEREAVEKAKSLLERIRPEQILIPYAQEPPADHASTNRILIAAMRQLRYVATVYEYPIWYWDQWPWIDRDLYQGGLRSFFSKVLSTGLGFKLIQDFKSYIPIADALEIKKEAINQYRSQMTRLVADPNWLTLGDIACGEFLNYFFQDREVFKISQFSPVL